MQILVAAATEMEIAPFKQMHPSADILITGVGIPAAIYQLTERLHRMDYHMVIQAGIAGSFVESIEPGTVLVVSEDTFADTGIREGNGFITLFEAGLAQPAAPYTNGWLPNEHPVIGSTGLQPVRSITVASISADPGYNRMMQDKYDPVLESMEGAALHYVCGLKDTPYLQLRAVSNRIGERDKSKWDIAAAVQQLNAKLEHIYHMVHGEIFNEHQ